MGTVQLAPAGVDIKAQTLPQLKINIAEISAGVEFNIGTVSGTVNVNIIDVASEVTFNVAAKEGYFYIRTEATETINIGIITSSIQVPIDIQGSYVQIPVDIQGQYITLEMDIVAQTLEYLRMDIASQSIGNIAINIAAQTVEALTFNIGAASAVLNFNIVGQSTAIMSPTDWATTKSQDYHAFGEVSSLAAGGEQTIISIPLTTNQEHWLYTIHISGTQPGLGKCIVDKTGGYDTLAFGYFSANNGYVKTWEVPVKRRKDLDAGITEISVVVKNMGSSAGAFAATLDGLRIIDTTRGEKTYDSQADWEACTLKTDISTTESPGDVVLALVS